MAEQASQSKSPEESSSVSQPENALAAEKLAKKFLDLRAEARRLRREAERREKEAEDLLTAHPLLGNIVGLFNRLDKKRKAEKEGKEKELAAKDNKKKQKAANRKAVVLPGKTMSQMEIDKEGGEVEKSGFYQESRFAEK